MDKLHTYYYYCYYCDFIGCSKMFITLQNYAACLCSNIFTSPQNLEFVKLVRICEENKYVVRDRKPSDTFISVLQLTGEFLDLGCDLGVLNSNISKQMRPILSFL